MPLVFVTDAPTLWDSEYADIVGLQYEFPAQYREYVQRGDRFLYYRGSRGAKQGGSGYFGDGVVGEVRPSKKPDHFIVQVHDVVLYDDVLGIRDAEGNYWETGSVKGTNWANGVRRISDEVFTGISRAAAVSSSELSTSPGIADPAHASAMERYSVEVVLRLLTDEFGSQAVTEMPPGNPGYDIAVVTETGELHVEVKGTILPAPVFHLSEGQRQHAELMGERFRLMVVHDIDVRAREHKVTSCVGPLSADRAALQPASWTGVLMA